MSFLDLYVAFFCIAIGLLILEVVLGMTLGIALAGSITFFVLGLLELIQLLHGLNNYLIVGSITFLISTFFVLRSFKSSMRKSSIQQDVNDY